MNLTEAINLAKQGRSVGWGTIINSTYNEKKFLVSKYKGVDSNKILHDSYVKALTSIRFLNNPNIFSSWLGIIIASITADELTKKKLADFSKADSYAGETWYSDILKDDNKASDSVKLSDKEAKDFSNQLINALSMEQKLCIVFRYYEGFTVREISKALGCSETAVISFLNAGIKKLKEKAEEIKKSCKPLAAFSNPVQLLLFLMKAEYDSIPFETAPDKIFNSIIEDTAAVIAEKTVVEEKEAEEELENEDEEEERKVGLLSGNKKAIVIIAIIIAITAGLTIHFVNGKSPAEPANNPDKPSESDTVSETNPTMDVTDGESSTEDNSESTSEEASSSTNPVTSQRTQSNNNNTSNSNGSQTYTQPATRPATPTTPTTPATRPTTPTQPATQAPPVTNPPVTDPPITDPPNTEPATDAPAPAEPDFEMPGIE